MPTKEKIKKTKVAKEEVVENTTLDKALPEINNTVSEELPEVKEVVKVDEVVEEMEAPKRSRYWDLKLIGISLIVITTVFLLSVLTLLLIRFSPTVRDWVLDISTDNQVEQNNGNKIVITKEEDVVINVVKESEDSVVSIAISQLTLTRDNGVVDKSSNIGTGFIVDPNGIIVTNQHVVSDLTTTYKVITTQGKEYDVTDIVRDDNSDIAILKIDATNLKPLELGDSDTLQVGQTVIAIGTPLGEYAGSVTTGVLSGLRRSVTASSGWFGATAKIYEDVLQTDAAVNPGNSGGPLISTQGKVIGVNFATTSGADNISFALPINRVKAKLEEYRTYGKFIKPYIGVSYQTITTADAVYYKDVVAGALIINIDANGPAAKAGIKRSDIITKINDKELTSPLSSVIQSHKVGEELTLEVWNDGNYRTVKLILTEAE